MTDVLVYMCTNMVQYRERSVGVPVRSSYAGLKKIFEVRSGEIEDKFISEKEPILEAIIDSYVR